MADGAATACVEMLGGLLFEQLNLCLHLHKEARNFQNEVDKMRSILRNADNSQEEEDESAKTSMEPVREALCDSEDVLDEYKLRLEVNREPGFRGFLCSTAFSIKQLKPRWQIAQQIQEVRDRIRGSLPERRDYHRPTIPSHASDSRLDALFIKESELVGVDVPRRQLMDLLSSKNESLLTISVFGMGGLGKTTLVKKVYEQAKVKFKTYAWISVSQNFRATTIFGNMMAEFYRAGKEHANTKKHAFLVVDGMTEAQLIEKLHYYLEKKRFLLVLDDVWTVEASKSLQRALPDGGRRSRVIFTTRIDQVAQSSAHTVSLPPLSPRDAWSLFCRKAFRRNEKSGSCPPSLETLAESFVRKCGGLPLAIVSLGSFLSTKPHGEWEMIDRNLRSELGTDHNLESMKRILLLSFNNLPNNLKSCFLFLSIFPEDYHFKRMKLIRLWIAEGLVESIQYRSLEEVADGYLNELIKTSLIQVSEWKSYGTAKTCQVPGIVREIIISKYEKQGFFLSLSSTSASSSVKPGRMIRRLSIYNQGETIPSWCEELTRLRSIFIFGADNASAAIKSFSGFRWLRVVDLENVALKSFPNGLTQSLHLRYLSMENANIKNLPNSVKKLKYLETLNLKGTLVRELPPTIQKLQCLRHLLVYKYNIGQDMSPFQTVDGVKVPAAGIRKLRSLQKLAYIEAESGVVAELGNLSELRKLGVIKLRREDGIGLCASVAKMRSLQALEIRALDENVVLDLQSLEHPPRTLHRLYIVGRLENVPRWISSVYNLVSLFLCGSRLKDDPLRALRSLPNLVRLGLTNAYDGDELRCEAGGYPKLKELRLEELTGLKQLEVEKGAMPNLACLYVGCCLQLLKVPSCLQHLSNLEFLSAYKMPKEFKSVCIKMGEGKNWILMCGTSDAFILQKASNRPSHAQG